MDQKTVIQQSSQQNTLNVEDRLFFLLDSLGSSEIAMICCYICFIVYLVFILLCYYQNWFRKYAVSKQDGSTKRISFFACNNNTAKFVKVMKIWAILHLIGISIHSKFCSPLGFDEITQIKI